MKLILENWRTFLNEEVQDKYQIFLDMDGVLVDMTEGVVDSINTNLQKVRNGASTDHNDPHSVHPGSKGRSQVLRKLAKEMEAEGRRGITAADFDHLTDLKDSGGDGPTGANKFIERYFFKIASNNEDWWVNLPPYGHTQALVDIANRASHNGTAIILSAPIDSLSISGKEKWVENNLTGIDLENVHVTPDKGAFLQKLNLPSNVIPVLIDDRAKYHQQFKDAGGQVIPWDVHNQAGSFDRASELLNSIAAKKKND